MSWFDVCNIIGISVMVFGFCWFIKSHIIDFNDGVIDFKPIIVMALGSLLLAVVGLLEFVLK